MMTKNTKLGSITSMIILIILAFCYQTAIARGNPLIATDRNTYNYGEKIRVYYYHAPGYSRDWICIVPKALWILKLETINIYQGEGEVS